MAHDPMVLIQARNAFYKRLHYIALSIFLLCVIIIIILAGMLRYLLRNPVHPLFFATDNVGRLIQVVPVNTPNMTLNEVSDWVVEAVQRSYSINFIDFRNQLQSAEQYFTNFGWKNYMQALRETNNLLAISDRKLISIAHVVEKPKIIAQGLLSGSYAWKFQMPVLVTYLQPPDYDESTQFVNALDVIVVVQRQQVLSGYKGLGIVQLIGTLPTASNQAPAQISATAG